MALRGATCLALCAALGVGLPGAAAAEASDAHPGASQIERKFRDGDASGALQQLEQALATRPGDARLRFLHGVLLAETGRSTEAAGVYERMTQEFPELPEPYNNLAVLQAAGGRLDAARSLLETALRLDPAYRAAQQNLGDVFVRLAQRAYEGAADGPRADPLLAIKLRLARELIAVR